MGEYGSAGSGSAGGYLRASDPLISVSDQARSSLLGCAASGKPDLDRLDQRRDRRRRKRRHAAHVDLARHEALRLTRNGLAKHEVAVPQQRQLFPRQARALAQQRDPVALQLLPQLLEASQFGAVVQARPGLRGLRVERVVGLVAEAGDTVFNQIGPYHALGQARIETSDHARFPVVAGGQDNILGVINARQWPSHASRGDDRTLASQLLQRPLYVPETLKGMELLETFRSSDVHVAFVIDEYGQVQGIETLQDLIDWPAF